MTRASVLAGLVLLAACSREPSPDALAKRNRALADASDPAVTAALEDPIMTDRDLTVADNSRRIRNVRGPAEAIYPSRTGLNAPAFAALQKLEARAPGCETGFRTDPAWAARLPAPFKLSPRATLVEAAGNTARSCASIMAAFRVSAAPDRFIAELVARATSAGYVASVQTRGADRVAGGRRAADGSTFYAVASPRAGASEVALLTARD